MSMRITLSNDEPGFSDARVAIMHPEYGRVVLHGGEKLEMVIDPGQAKQLNVQCLRRGGDPAPERQRR